MNTTTNTDTTGTDTTGTLPVPVAEGNHAALVAALERHGLPGFLTMPYLLAATGDLEELLDGAGIAIQARPGLTMSLSQMVPVTVRAALRREDQGWALVALEVDA